MEQHFPGEVILIPGWEIEIRPPRSPFDEYQVSELFLPGGGVFRIYCHPGYYTPNIIIEENIHAIEIDNHLHNWHIRPAQVQETADAYGLLTVAVSDAHVLENVGVRHTEVELEELYRRAMPRGGMARAAGMTAAFATALFEKRGAVAHLSLNRPAVLNA